MKSQRGSMSAKGTAAVGGKSSSIMKQVMSDLAEIADDLYRVQLKMGIALDPGIKVRWGRTPARATPKRPKRRGQ
jgi:hypothetical protein